MSRKELTDKWYHWGELYNRACKSGQRKEAEETANMRDQFLQQINTLDIKEKAMSLEETEAWIAEELPMLIGSELTALARTYFKSVQIDDMPIAAARIAMGLLPIFHLLQKKLILVYKPVGEGRFEEIDDLPNFLKDVPLGTGLFTFYVTPNKAVLEIK